MVRHAWLLALCGACGVDVVELAPAGDVLVLGDVPADTIARFATGAAMPDPKMLALGYPPDGVALPANVAPIRFAWAGKPMSTFELTLQGAHTLRVYTRDTSLVVPRDRWSALLTMQELRVSLRALEDGGKRLLRESKPRTLAIHAPLNGTFYLAPAMDQSDQSARARISDSSVSLDASRARALGAAFRGRVATVGASQINVEGRALRVPAGGRIAHPSWSPDGSTLVFTYWAPELAGDEGSVLAQLTLDGVFNTLKSDGAMNARRPRYAPDGRSIVFEGGKLDDADLFVIANTGGMARRVMCDAPGMMMAKTNSSAPAFADGWLAFVSTRAYVEPAHAQVWLAELSLDDLRCTAPFWFPAQDAQRDYEALYFERD